jgi:hypothetical protein
MIYGPLTMTIFIMLTMIYHMGGQYIWHSHFPIKIKIMTVKYFHYPSIYVQIYLLYFNSCTT